MRLSLTYDRISHMRLDVSVLAPRGDALPELSRALASTAGMECDVQPLASLDAVRRRVQDRARRHLVLVHESFSEGRRRALAVVSRILAEAPDVPIVVVAERGDVSLAARAVEAGANDLLVLGDRLEERIETLLGKLRSLLEAIDRNRSLDEQNEALRSMIQARFKIIGDSPQIRRVVEQVRRVAGIPRPVLIVGERGTGKELVARAIHFTGGPASRPIVTVNCAAFNDALLESELFGHEKGAFTGADGARLGKFEIADSGTLFLDEIANMSLAFQRKILRVVEYGTFARVGGTREIRSTARIVAATNADLKERMARGEFLSDLYDRLAFEVIEVPALREREGDVEVLAHHFLNEFAREIPAIKGKTLSRAAVARLRKYRFPGNVR